MTLKLATLMGEIFASTSVIAQNGSLHFRCGVETPAPLAVACATRADTGSAPTGKNRFCYVTLCRGEDTPTYVIYACNLSFEVP